MATRETAPWFLLICALLSFSIVNADENQTDPNFNVTFGDQNVTDNFTDTNTATTDYTVPTTIAGNSEEPVQPTAGDLPLPVSGQLLTPVTDGEKLYAQCYLNFLLNISILFYSGTFSNF